MVTATTHPTESVRQDPPCDDPSRIEREVRSALQRSTYGSVRHVTCRMRQGVLTLHGDVPSYFQKQIAQTVVQRQLDGSAAIVNLIRVVGADSSAAARNYRAGIQ